MADLNAPGCGTLSGHCIDESAFGPVPEAVPNPPSYWSSTINPPTVSFPNYAWAVDFLLASPFITPRSSGEHVLVSGEDTCGPCVPRSDKIPASRASSGPEPH